MGSGLGYPRLDRSLFTDPNAAIRDRSRPSFPERISLCIAGDFGARVSLPSSRRSRRREEADFLENRKGPIRLLMSSATFSRSHLPESFREFSPALDELPTENVQSPNWMPWASGNSLP